MIRTPLALAAALVALALQAPSAHADPALAGTFGVSGMPGRITAGPDGNVWFTLSGSSDSKEIGKITPNGAVTEYDSPNDLELTGLSAGPDGNLWATALKLGSARYSIPAGKTKRVKVKLSKAGLRLLRKKPTLQAVATLTTAGKTSSHKVTLKRKK